MKTVLVKMTFAYPEQFRGDGKDRERIPNHPTRPARSTDSNTWWEDVDGFDYAFLGAFGAIVREAPRLETLG